MASGRIAAQCARPANPLRVFEQSYTEDSGEVTPLLFPIDFADEIIEHPRAPELTRRRSSDDSFGPETPPEWIDAVWQNVREAKERGFKHRQGRPEGPARHPAQKPKLVRRKSIVNFKESADGRTVTAVFDLEGVKKEDMHVSFHSKRVTITWKTVSVIEYEEEGTMVREREEKQFSRTIPLPEDTKFEEVRAIKEGGRLVLHYPNMRCIRVERRPTEATQRKPSGGSGRHVDHHV
ncbi:hypothetical protein GLOTRDRAFT_140446 [Gloeophyllum trabeum ATCC 11539]|uniref:SHSP domain-containing protein n=1 Tax=Gloeophyllum trabeum (strain ATCC 11539 / FP-39264 / Madison 617) TaxID=670483 RepID=S7RJM9_GLOTA|nr:uncharacterized protein GLOTRDRAFT_140446 [Gloeophyllum trabeum ATCC 11539]EPQ52844.1 hypothetical protein GLOTRDRAFT_140446 [Gloeophyllum trabeum ATCC 11539]